MEIKNTIEKLKTEQQKLRGEVFEKISGYLIGAFGLVAGLAWNEAIKALIEYWFPLNGAGIAAKFLYAAILTVILVIFTVYIVKLFKKKDNRQ